MVDEGAVAGRLVLPPCGTQIVVALVVLSMIFGGGSTSNPQTELLLQLIYAGLVLVLLIGPRRPAEFGPVNRWALVMAALILVLPVVQLVPLPPSVWQALPGRAIEVESLSRVGAADRWMPISMTPPRTFASLLGMICPAVLLVLVSQLGLRSRAWICAGIAVVGGLSIVLGVLQLSHTGGYEWSLYTDYHHGYLVGFHGSRNAETDVLQIALLAFAVVGAARLADGRRHAATWLVLLVGVLLSIVAIVLTGSRGGMLLFPLTAAFAAAMLAPPLLSRIRSPGLVVGGAVAALVLAAIAAFQFASVQKVVTRFGTAGEGRWDLWSDTVYAIKQVWPVGSGIGSFGNLFWAAERLEMIDTFVPHRAHNDWLEFTLEAGLPGIIVLVLGGVLLVYLAARALIGAYGRDSSALRRAQVLFGCGVLLLLGLHSIVEYPMRTMALASLAAVAAAFLLPPPTRAKPA